MKANHKFIEYKPGKFELVINTSTVERGIEEAWLPYRVAMLHFVETDVEIFRLGQVHEWHPAPRRTLPIEINTPPIPGVLSPGEIAELLDGLDGPVLSPAETPSDIDLLAGL